MKKLRRHWIEVSLVVVMVVMTIHLLVGAAKADVIPFIIEGDPIPFIPDDWVDPDVVCDAYSSPDQTPWDLPDGWFACLEGCFDAWIAYGWSSDDIAACLECCDAHYYMTPLPPFPPIEPDGEEEQWADIE